MARKVKEEEGGDEDDLERQRDVWYQKINDEERDDGFDSEHLYDINQYPGLSLGRRSYDGGKYKWTV